MLNIFKDFISIHLFKFNRFKEAYFICFKFGSSVECVGKEN